MSKWLSRKLVMTLVGVILVPLLQQWGVPQDTVTWLVGLIATYVGAQGVADAARVWNATDPPPHA